MTVGELIEELHKYAPHHRVFVEFPDYSEPNSYGIDSRMERVADLSAQGDCCVVIDATGGVR
jgi:hypothetical protein